MLPPAEIEADIPVFLTLDGKSNADFGFWVLSSTGIPLAPKTIDNMLHIRGKPGKYDFQPDADSRTFKFRCAIKATESSRNLETIFYHLRGFLTNSDGSPRTMQLRLSTYPNFYYKVRYSGELDAKRDIMHTASSDFSLTFLAADPYAYGDYQIFTHTINQNYEVIRVIQETQLGTLESAPVITIKNTGKTPITGIRIEILQTKK